MRLPRLRVKRLPGCTWIAQWKTPWSLRWKNCPDVRQVRPDPRLPINPFLPARNPHDHPAKASEHCHLARSLWEGNKRGGNAATMFSFAQFETAERKG